MIKQQHHPSQVYEKPAWEGPCFLFFHRLINMYERLIVEGPGYLFLQLLSRVTLFAYFRHVKVIYRTPLPMHGPMMVASNHTNMGIDPAMLTDTFPYGRACHFWALARFFQYPGTGPVLLAAGVLPVDPQSHGNDKLFETTSARLENGGVVALFPEGTSYTRPDHLPFKDGLSWAAFKYLEQQKSKHMQDTYLPIIPVGITYTCKNKWRSDAVVEYGEPIIVGPSDLARYQKDSKNAVKELTDQIVEGVEKGTVNAADWDTIYAASEARFLLFGDTTNDQLENYVHVLQSLVQIFSTEDLDDDDNDTQETLIMERKELKKQLAICYEDLKRMKLSALDIRRYDKKGDITLGKSSLRLLSGMLGLIPHLPLIIPGALIHAPFYILGQGVNRYEVYTESVSQNKMLMTFLIVLPYYFIVWCVLWWWMGLTLLNGPISFVTAALISLFHILLIDKLYGMVKDIALLARVFMVVSGLDQDRQELELVIQRRSWCFHRVRFLIAQLAKTGNPYARTLVDLGQNAMFPKYVFADGDHGGGDDDDDDDDDLTCL